MSARYDRWSVFADAVGGYAEEGVNERISTQLCTLSVAATGKLRFAMSDFSLGYQLGRWSLAGRWRPFSLGVYAGTRYMYFNVKLSARAGVVGAAQRAASASDSWAWADPLIGARWEVSVLDRLSLDFRGDIGGFGGELRSHLGARRRREVLAPLDALGDPALACGRLPGNLVQP
ncbi:MAG: hypothetical protein E6J81_04905 [Deltaproteobacteria bacterium]|nr:MAG: hypothetical protein E6J81_04905 [Deltaproteobacteria bacterium]